ncbi:hydrogenase maturation protease [Dictyobacter formicarum]|uniref:Peptidase M52 n=1 Tax=Dictyobacter formicarum TaxID=2778368 RepID=A0ABQ3VDN0_9CHLR|nr:hydrogenase maturation protease [Dictyobacter formicarum]GHO83859.1 peptidase M52 [Dictyobacter formicarum]
MSGQAHSKEERRILIAGIGNIFFGDDGFGVEVAQRLLAGRYSANVEIVDFGIRGVDLAYTLLEDYDELILVDAVSRGGAPGTLYLIEPDRLSAQQSEARESFLDAHSMDPLKVLAFARNMGARPIHTLLVGCEPAAVGNADEDLVVGLSEVVQSMIPGAIEMIDLLVDKLSVTSEIILPLKEARYGHSSS